MYTQLTLRFRFRNKISFSSSSFVLLFFLAVAKLLGVSTPISDCFWSTCSEKQATNASNAVCGSEVAKVRMKEACYNNSVHGFKYFCCSSFGNKCPIPAVNVMNDLIWWLKFDGQPVLIAINCPVPAIGQYIDSFVVNFFVFNKNNPLGYKTIKVGNTDTLNQSGFIKNAPLKVIIHGFVDSSHMFVSAITKKYLQFNETVNIIGVDWQSIASILCYNIPAEFTKFVGERSALLLKFLLDENVVALKDIHLIGHSLGAQAAGFAGKSFFKYTGKKVARITGLDVASPLFEGKGPTERLDRSDAYFVDIIHTSILPLAVGLRGFMKVPIGIGQPVGHADFYVNKGEYQPICRGLGIATPFCGHYLSIIYFAESILPTGDTIFRGKLCKDYHEARQGACRGLKTSLMGSCTDVNNRY